MKVFAFDSIALDFATSLGYSNIVIPHHKCNGIGMHLSENHHKLYNYMFNFDFEFSENHNILEDDNFELYEIFDLIILPFYLKAKLNNKIINKLPIVYYGTEEYVDYKDGNGKSINFVDSGGNIWDYCCSPILSLEYLVKNIEKLNIDIPNNFTNIKNEYLDFLQEFKIKELQNKTIAFITPSDISDENVFIYSPGFISDIYKNLEFQFPKTSLIKTGDGISGIKNEIIKDLYKKFDYVFVSSNKRKSNKTNMGIKNFARALSKFEVFEIQKEFVYQIWGIEGMKQFLETIKHTIENYHSSKMNTLIRIKNAKEAREFYKTVLNFNEKWHYFYTEKEEGGMYEGELLRSSLYKYNLEFIIGEEMPDRKNSFASFQINSNDYEDKLEDFFEALSKEGTVITPFLKNFTGYKYGEVLDKFGVHWEVRWKEVGNE